MKNKPIAMGVLFLLTGHALAASSNAKPQMFLSAGRITIRHGDNALIDQGDTIAVKGAADALLTQAAKDECTSNITADLDAPPDLDKETPEVKNFCASLWRRIYKQAHPTALVILH